MNPPSISIFGFTTFISALALLVIVYTVSDIRYRFRVAITPIPLFGITYFLIALLGFGTLIIDTWFAEQWLMPNFLSNQAIWQATFGVIFLSLVLTWVYYAVIKPPIFRRNNHKKFADALYQAILKGSNTELPTIASELRKSAKSIIKLVNESSHSSGEPNQDRKIKKRHPGAEDYAHDLLLLIGNRKFCQHIVASSPMTAIAFFESMTAEQKYEIPIGQFAKNISTEALVNKNSILYHEDEGYRSGLIGYVKPFSRSIYGNHRLVEALAAKHGSPLDIHHELAWSWDATQLKAYCRCAMLTWQNYIEEGNWHQHSFALYRAFGIIKDSCRDIYKLDASESYSTDIDKRLSVAVDFFKNAIELLDKQQSVPKATLRIRSSNQPKSFYDYLSDHIFNIIFSASLVKSPPDKCWMIQHNIVWTAFFYSYNKRGQAWKIICHKLRRQLYDEVCQLEKLPNYKSAGILGFLLNIMGLEIGDRESRNRDYYALHKAILGWTENNYLKLVSIQPSVAKSCCIGSISFDEEKSRLVKTYERGLNLEPPQKYLTLSKKE